jgi:putative transposase
VGGPLPAAPIEAEAHLIACMRYIELNPVRARMVRRPGNYPWSSHQANAATERDPLVTPHPLYAALGGSAGKRAAAYAALFGAALPVEFVDALRRATNGGWALGGARWRAKVERVANRRAAPLPPGPPRRDPERKPSRDARQGRLL